MCLEIGRIAVDQPRDLDRIGRVGIGNRSATGARTVKAVWRLSKITGERGFDLLRRVGDRDTEAIGRVYNARRKIDQRQGLRA
jgi:hypothetical protein